MGNVVQQTSFSGGELSPALYARVDLARWQNSLRTGLNFITLPYGGQVNRPGTQYVETVQDVGYAGRLIPFEYNDEITYVISLINEAAFFYTNGAPLLDGMGDHVYIVTPWTTADLPFLRFTQSADVLYVVHPDHAPRTISRLTATSFELGEFDHVNGPFQTLNARNFVYARVSAGVGSVQILANDNIFAAGDVGRLFYAERRDLVNIKPWTQGERGIAVGDKRRSDSKTYRAVTVPTGGGSSWTETGSFKPIHEFGRAWDGGADVRTNGSQTWIVGIEWEYLDSGYGIAEITLVTSAAEVSATVLRPFPEEIIGSAGTIFDTYVHVGDGSTVSFSVAGYASTNIIDFECGVEGTPVEIIAFDESSGEIVLAEAPALGDDIGIIEYVKGSRHGSDYWALGAWSVTTGYPSEVEFFSDRLVFARTDTDTQTVWMSKSGAYADFGKSTPQVDDDAITATLNTRKVNAINDLVPLNNLILLTRGGEWKTATGSEDVLSFETVAFKPQSVWGAEDVPALTVGTSAIFVQRLGHVIRDLGYRFEQDAYTGDDLTAFASHVLEGRSVREWCYQQTPHSVIWICCDDGTLLSMTYMREQQVVGWNRHDVGGSVESLCSVREANQDAVYMVVVRTILGSTLRYLERLSDRYPTDIVDRSFLDSYLTYDGRNTAATTMTLTAASYAAGQPGTMTASVASFVDADIGDYIVLGYDAGVENPVLRVRCLITARTSTTVVSVLIETPATAAYQAQAVTDWAWARDVISELAHLGEETVGVLADGDVQTQKVPDDGEITLDRHASLVHVGIPYNSDFETLDLTVPEAPGLRLQNKLIKRVGLIVRDTRGVWAGPDADNLFEHDTRTFSDQYGSPAERSAVTELWISGEWNRNGRVFIRQSDPLPITILGILPDFEGGI